MSKFLSDLSEGKKKEALVVQRLQQLKFTAQLSNSKQYDVEWEDNGKNLKGEVKFDKASDRTGNIAIEFHNSKLNKPSGLTATKADVWFIVFPDDVIWWCYVEDLKKFVKENKPKKVVIGGGDKNADLYLYSKNFIEKLFKVL